MRVVSGNLYILILFCALILSNSTARAHKVVTAADVGATLHLEPNDNPRAGEPTKTWFALTRKGGKVIPLASCDCKLAVYAEPHSPTEPPLLEPSLEPMTAERYKGIPGTKITFPRPGAYLLQLGGKPKDGKSFQSFELKFPVTVAAGSAAINNTQDKAQEVQDTTVDVQSNQSQGVPIWAIASLVFALAGVSFAILRRVKRD
ncbi:hypothetical protein NUACC21_02960 [Scytonema sp. NUACC21]